MNLSNKLGLGLLVLLTAGQAAADKSFADVYYLQGEREISTNNPQAVDNRGAGGRLALAVGPGVFVTGELNRFSERNAAQRAFRESRFGLLINRSINSQFTLNLQLQSATVKNAGNNGTGFSGGAILAGGEIAASPSLILLASVGAVQFEDNKIGPDARLGFRYQPSRVGLFVEAHHYERTLETNNSKVKYGDIRAGLRFNFSE